MSGRVSVPPPSLAAPSVDAALPYGRPVRRRVGVPLTLGLVVALVAALWMLHDSVTYYRVDSGSMEPTLPIGSRVAAQPGLSPRVGEIVVFRAPPGAVPDIPVCGTVGEGTGFSQACGLATPGASHAIFIKRIVAGPGDVVMIRGGDAVVNGIARSEPYARPCDDPDCNFPTPVRVPAGQFYVLGDNRGDSDDSRFWGPVPSSSIVAVAVTCAPLQTDCQPRH